MREFAAPVETLEETLGSSRGLRLRNESVRIQEGNSTFYRPSGLPGEVASGAFVCFLVVLHVICCFGFDYRLRFIIRYVNIKKSMSETVFQNKFCC